MNESPDRLHSAGRGFSYAERDLLRSALYLKLAENATRAGNVARQFDMLPEEKRAQANVLLMALDEQAATARDLIEALK